VADAEPRAHRSMAAERRRIRGRNLRCNRTNRRSARGERRESDEIHEEKKRAPGRAKKLSMSMLPDVGANSNGPNLGGKKKYKTRFPAIALMLTLSAWGSPVAVYFDKCQEVWVLIISSVVMTRDRCDESRTYDLGTF